MANKSVSTVLWTDGSGTGDDTPSAYVSNRSLSQDLKPTSGEYTRDGTVLEILGISLDDLRDKKILEVGIGGGMAFEQAQVHAKEFGWQYFGVDLAHLRGAVGFGIAAQRRQLIAIGDLQSVIDIYPDHFRAADATKEIPLPDDAVDICFSCLALPAYARHQAEAINSILEMIRVAREKVVFTIGTHSVDREHRIVEFGITDERNELRKFEMDLQSLFEELELARIEISFTETDFGNASHVVSAHLDVSSKDTAALDGLRQKHLKTKWLVETGDWTDIPEGVKGVRFRTFKYANFLAEEKDGAEVEIMAGKNTPVQYNATAETEFTEIPIYGKLYFLHVDTNGKFTVYRYDSEKNKKPHFLKVLPGEIITWVASNNQDKAGIAKVMEHEKPGFKENDFDPVELNAKTHKGTNIPIEFWQVLEQLQSGNETFDYNVEELS